MKSPIFAGLLVQALLTTGQAIRSDPGTYGPVLEIEHLFYGQWPTGVAASSTGRLFACFPAGLDANNTNTGSGSGASKYQVAELLSHNIERPYPSVAYNSPAGGAINYTTNPVSSANYQNKFIGVQSVVFDSLDRLWALDTGRAIDPKSGMLTQSSYGGPKLVAINITTNTVIKTIVLSNTVAYPDSYLNDVRFDLRPHLSNSKGEGIAYITDSSAEGRDGIIIVDIATGNSWRHLNSDPATHPELEFVPFVWGQPFYGFMAGQPRSYISFGADGIALSQDGSTLYFAPTSGRYLYKIATSLLRANNANSEVAAQAGVSSVTQKGVSDGFETDTNGFIYMGNAEQSAIVFWNPHNSSVQTFVRDPRISWPDTLSIAGGCLYFTANQLTFSPQTWPGTDRRVHPYVLFRAPLPYNGTKVLLI